MDNLSTTLTTATGTGTSISTLPIYSTVGDWQYTYPIKNHTFADPYYKSAPNDSNKIWTTPIDDETLKSIYKTYQTTTTTTTTTPVPTTTQMPTQMPINDETPALEENNIVSDALAEMMNEL